MEKKNNCLRVGSLSVLWGVLAILLCAAPSLHADVTVPAGDTWDIDYAVTGNLWIDGTANLLTGAHITQELGAHPGSTVNIYGGQVVWWLVTYTSGDPTENPNVTVYGAQFQIGTGAAFLPPADVPIPKDTLYVLSESGDVLFNLLVMSGISIHLRAPDGGESITVNIEKAKVCWDHSDIHVDGKLYLPQGFWMDNLKPVGSAVVTLAGVEEVADQNVDFEIAGKKDDKWEYKDKENLYGNIKEFKIDWKGAKFDYKGKDGFHIHTHFIGGTETTLCIHCDHISGPFTVSVSVNGTTIAYDEERIITTGVEYEPQKEDNSHVHFTLPFELTSEMTIGVSGAIELTINVADYYEEGFAKFKLVSAFDSGSFSDGSATSPDKLESVISLGDMIAGSDLIGGDKSWTKKDNKHWEYK